MTLMVPSYFICNRYLMAPPYLIWNRYCMVSPHVCMVPQHVHMVPLHVQSDGTPLPYMEQVLHGPHMYVCSAHMYDMIFSGQLRKSPLHVLTMTEGWLSSKLEWSQNSYQLIRASNSSQFGTGNKILRKKLQSISWKEFG